MSQWLVFPGLNCGDDGLKNTREKNSDELDW